MIIKNGWKMIIKKNFIHNHNLSLIINQIKPIKNKNNRILKVTYKFYN